MPDELTFLEVPLSTVTLLGKVLLAAGRVESVVHELLWDLDVDPTALGIRPAVRRLRSVAGADGLPEHARIDPDQLSRWGDRVVSAMDHRDQLFHATTFGRGPGLEPMAMHLRTGNVKHLDDRRTDRLLDQLVTLMQEGVKLHAGLLRCPRQGVYVRNVHRPHVPWVMVIQDAPGSFVAPRPTPEEIRTWWDAFGPSPSVEPGDCAGTSLGDSGHGT
jgi:hypothetical protein